MSGNQQAGYKTTQTTGHPYPNQSGGRYFAQPWSADNSDYARGVGVKKG